MPWSSDSRRWVPALLRRRRAVLLLGRLRARPKDEDPLTSLRKAESAGVDDSVGPPVTQPLKPRHDYVQGSSLRESQHEWHVLQEDPRDRPRFEQAKHFADQSRVRPLDSGRLTRLAEILAGKATDQEVDVGRDLLYLPDVVFERKRGETSFEHCPRGRVDLAEHHGFVTGAAEAEFETTNACEQPCDSESPPRDHAMLEQQDWIRATWPKAEESVLSPFLDSSRLLCGDHVFSVSIVPRGADTRAGFRLLVAQMARAGRWVGRARRDGQARQPVTGPRPWAGSAATLQG